jgi:hypothetical protein
VPQQQELRKKEIEERIAKLEQNKLTEPERFTLRCLKFILDNIDAHNSSKTGGQRDLILELMDDTTSN